MHRLRRAWAAWQRRMRAPALADHARCVTLMRRAFAALVCHVMARRRSRCDHLCRPIGPASLPGSHCRCSTLTDMCQDVPS